jgi:Asp-tRNA(Asn)/Glu-tRNA(Gln) amidotransferase A subunit family amidase
VSATEVLQAHLTQIAARNPTLNAVITLDAERCTGYMGHPFGKSRCYLG